jgi:ribulose-phosphate 3-epimerase
MNLPVNLPVSLPINLIAPSLLSCDFVRLAEEIAAVEKAGADWLHVDVMDGHFVNNLTLGPPIISRIKAVSRVPLDIHLMIERPENSLDQYLSIKPHVLTIHVEATSDVASALRQMRAAGVMAGLTLRPQTDINVIMPFLELCDLVLVMTVNPGWGGQKFMDEQVNKIKLLSETIKKRNLNTLVEVDGGINADTAQICRAVGAQVFVAGNAVFKNNDYGDAIRRLRG